VVVEVHGAAERTEIAKTFVVERTFPWENDQYAWIALPCARLRQWRFTRSHGFKNTCVSKKSCRRVFAGLRAGYIGSAFVQVCVDVPLCPLPRSLEI